MGREAKLNAPFEMCKAHTLLFLAVDVLSFHCFHKHKSLFCMGLKACLSLNTGEHLFLEQRALFAFRASKLNEDLFLRLCFCVYFLLFFIFIANFADFSIGDKKFGGASAFYFNVYDCFDSRFLSFGS